MKKITALVLCVSLLMLSGCNSKSEPINTSKLQSLLQILGKVMWDQQSQCFKADDKCLVGNTHAVCHLTELDRCS